MNLHNIEDKLTPAAREALDELIKDLKDQILSSASRNSLTLSNMPNEITVRDIITAFQETQGKNTFQKINRKQRYYLIIFLSGIVYSVLGFTLFLFKGNWFSHYNSLQSIGLVAGLIGILISMFSLTLAILSRPGLLIPGFLQNDRSNLSISNFIQKWIEIEMSIRNIASSKYGESTADKPLFSMINELNNSGMIDKLNSLRLKKLLEIRNGILHAKISPSQNEILGLIEDADALLAHLKEKTNKLN